MIGDYRSGVEENGRTGARFSLRVRYADFGRVTDMFAARTQWNLQPNAFAQALAEARREGKQLLDLTVSNPTEAGFTYGDSWQRAWQAPDRGYDPQPQGSLEARRAIC